MATISHITESIKLGDEWPAVLRVSPIDGHSSNGVAAAFSVFDTKDGLKRVELRHKQNTYALFVFRWTDQVLPVWWQNSEIVWALPAAQQDDAPPASGARCPECGGEIVEDRGKWIVTKCGECGEVLSELDYPGTDLDEQMVRI